MAATGVAQLGGPEGGVALARLRTAGMSMVHLNLSWPATAPAQEPRQWEPANPADSHYDWSAADTQIKRIVAAGMQPIAIVADAPVWARLHPEFYFSPPKSAAYGQFLRAAATRYSGTYGGLPRVRYWEIWNEPNISLYFVPQYDYATGQFTSPDVYRDMVNAGAEAVHGVHADNLVIAGQTAPFRDITPDVQQLDNDWGPLKFMRRLLCVDDSGRRTCDKTVAFDVWSTHPYTSGGPTHHAALPYDVSLGDLPKMRATLDAATRAGHILSAAPPRFWVTEFSWDSKPPDKCSPPIALLKRWVPEAFYRMWASGVDLITWFQFMDDPPTVSFYQSGLFFNAPSVATARPKPFIEALRFPFVALRNGSRVYVWAHTPYGKPARFVVQQRRKGRWAAVIALKTDAFGIGQSVVKAKPVGEFRAVLVNGENSLPFSMRVPPDQFFNPFGTPALLEPNGKSCQS